MTLVHHPTNSSPRPELGVARRPLARSTDLAVLGGVCAGIAVRFGLRERTVRVVFALSALLYGAGLLLYVALWLFVPRFSETQSIGHRLADRNHRRELQVALFSTVIVIVLLLATDSLALQGTSGVVWTVVLSALGLVAVWSGASSDERIHLESLTESAPILGGARARGVKALALRVVPGVILVVVGLNILGRIGGVWGAAVPALVGAAVLLGGLLVLLAPWWLTNVRDLSKERRERVRIEERTALITHVHDSVLQTLTLIERAAGDNPDVVRLARAQERELREWLFDPDSVTRATHANATMTSLAAAIQRDVERDYGVKVELVTVGDLPADDSVIALCAAAREACVNAAKWSGANQVSMFCEVEPERVCVFVRDTGRGFDPDAVATDRHGIAQSIRERVESVEGSATIRSAPGSGTDVELCVPR
ncbi:MAG: PspC domain-containing protein [Acidimicrobiales bacterium]